MTLPTPQYPDKLNTIANLYDVKDALRLTLAQDYTPGDSVIYVDGNSSTMERFPDKGIITLTEQCSDPKVRATSFYYNTKSNTDFYFADLEILEGMQDVPKPKDFTNVTLNVVASHHNTLKDALINIEEYIGVKNSSDPDSLNYKIDKIRKKIYAKKV